MFKRWHYVIITLVVAVVFLTEQRLTNAQAACPNWAVERAFNLSLLFFNGQLDCDQYLGELRALPAECQSHPPGCPNPHLERAQMTACLALTGEITLEQLYAQVMSLPAACFPAPSTGGYGGGTGGGDIYRDDDSVIIPNIGGCDSSGCYAFD